MKRNSRKYLVNTIILIGVILSGMAIMAKPLPDHPFFRQESVLVMAHRGGRNLWPENTLYAFKNAVEMGVDVLEMDVHSTKDGELIVMHDDTVDRTTNGTGQVQAFTLDALQALDAGYRWTGDDDGSYPYRGIGVRVPTLSEVFTAFPETPMNIEIKQSKPSISEQVCRLIRDYQMSQRVLVASFNQETIQEFRSYCPEVATTTGENEVRLLYGLSLGYLGRFYPPPAQALQVPEFSGKIHVVTPRFIQAAHGRNMDVHVWTVNDPTDMQRFLDLGVDGIITDNPDILLTVLDR